MRTKPIVLAVLATGFLLVGAAGAAVAQPEDPGQSGEAGPGDDAGPGSDAGPPEDMPEPVPEFVSDVHATISDFLSGGVENLGEAVSDLTPDDETAEENADADAGDANADAEQTDTDDDSDA